MKPIIEPPPDQEIFHVPADAEQADRDAIHRELDNILTSRFFRSAGRCKQFLTYVVEQKLDGHPEQLKERTIGVEVFQRPAGYTTGDDPVVRVQAGEVRRRLEQYYQAPPIDHHVYIQLPIGSYSPVFRWAPPAMPAKPPAIQLPSVESEAPQKSRHGKSRWIATIAFSVTLIAGLVTLAFQRPPVKKSALDQFWGPAFLTRQPVLICLAKPVAYRPKEEVYKRYSRNHPGTFQTEAERTNMPLPLDADTKLAWRDMFIYTDYGVAAGDVYAAVALSALLGKLEKPSQLRIGTNYTYEDLRNSPAVIVGGFNNKWTMQLTSNLHFAFVEQDQQYMIREQLPGGRIWKTRTSPEGETIEDFGIVSRMLNSKTGQFTVAVAGIGPKGTQAAGEFASSAQYLEEAFRHAPADWAKGNLVVVLETSVTDSVAGPPHAVAAYYW